MANASSRSQFEPSSSSNGNGAERTKDIKFKCTHISAGRMRSKEVRHEQRGLPEEFAEGSKDCMKESERFEHMNCAMFAILNGC